MKKEGRIAIKKTAVANNLSIVIVKNVLDGIGFANEYAPEHMQLMVSEPMKWFPKSAMSVRFPRRLFAGGCGRLFFGNKPCAPDRRSCALLFLGFRLKRSCVGRHFRTFPKGRTRKAVGPVTVMSTMEGFNDKHGGSVRVRFERIRR